MLSGNFVNRIAKFQNVEEFQDHHWTGTFEEYLQLVKRNPKVTRTAHQRLYDMVLSFGTEEYFDNKKKIVRYNFFNDPIDNGKDAVFGLDIPLMKLVNFFKSAANYYGTEKRVLLLHGPVGSSKSTIVRLLKKGIEYYSRTPEGALYTFEWVDVDGQSVIHCPMNDEPLNLIPLDWREQALEELGLHGDTYRITTRKQLNPHCRFIFNNLMEKYKGNWEKVIAHIRVKRLIFSEQDRIGVGTFQPKDEKN
ncbi:MAG: serine protein kinase, partial [Myxococcales bacterium]|nr:serine protein kinase [Myxococcales bacterium]